ncbi:MAG: dTDP-4-dehydrorhamnose 3,5-epimerase family protein [Rhodothermales bacterium]
MSSKQAFEWITGDIDGCVVRPLSPYLDERGWLLEVFRQDELPADLWPVMGYVSMTRSGVGRGPHEHNHQTDLFAFFDGRFRLYLWDNRTDSPTFRHYRKYDLGRNDPAVVIVPPGVVHGYRNVGASDALIINCPNRLYGGHGKAEEIDEIRHEADRHSPFQLA